MEVELKMPDSEFLTVEEVAKMLKVSPDTATRRFETVPGVIDLGHRETLRKRRYRLLRIPKSVFQQFLRENQVGT